MATAQKLIKQVSRESNRNLSAQRLVDTSDSPYSSKLRGEMARRELAQERRLEGKERFEQRLTRAGQVIKAGYKAIPQVQKSFGKNIAASRKFQKTHGQTISKGILGITQALMPQELPSYGGSAGYSRVSSSGRGRGRPTGTYTYQIPGVGPVPIQAFKRWQAQQRSQARVRMALAQARIEAQPPMDHVRGYSQDMSEAAFLASDGSQPMPSAADVYMQQRMAMQQQQAMQGQMPMQQRPSLMQGVANLFTSKPQGQQMPMQMQQPAFPIAGEVRNPFPNGDNVFGTKAPRLSILGTPQDNILNAERMPF